jgi:predicted Zn-dependent protease
MPMAIRVRVASALVLTCAGALALSAQAPATQKPLAAETSAQVDAYHALVVQYASGNVDEAISRLTRHATSETERVQRLVAWDPPLMRVAAMLETDAAFDLRTPIASLPFRLDRADAWLEKADLAERANTPRTLRRRWFQVVGRVLVANGLVSNADRLLSVGVKLYPDDFDLLLTFGTAKEALALSVSADLSTIQASTRALLRTREIALSLARTALERVVKGVPGSAEARLRLAHIYVVEHDDGRAAPLLEAARSLKPRPPVDYLASIMLGEILARRNQLEPALKLFQHARELMPNARSAYLAQAHALRSAGRLDEAAKGLQAMLARRDHDADPWKQYSLGFDFDLSKLNALRREVRGQ